MRSQTRTRQTRFQSSRRGSSITTHPRTTPSYQARRKEVEEVEEEEEHEGEVGDSKAEEEEVGRRSEGELSSRQGRRARVDAGSKQHKHKDKKATKASFLPISSQGGQVNYQRVISFDLIC